MAQSHTPLVSDRDMQRTSSIFDQVAYKAIPGSEHVHAASHVHIDESTCGGRLIKSLWFQNVMGLVILANSAILGLETDISQEYLHEYLYWASGNCFDTLEDVFLCAFFLETLLKLCVEKADFFNCYHDDFTWNVFDFFIVSLGVFDLLARKFFRLKGTGGFAQIFRVFRLLRILRIFRLLKFLKRLYLLAMGLIEAAKAIFWVTILMSFFLYICALVLVKTVGRPPDEDPHYAFMNHHFGNIPDTMITLFILMSSPNLPIYQEEVGLLDAHPSLTMFLIVFITFGSFGCLAMLTGVINESMFENNELRKEDQRLEHEKMRHSLGERCADLFLNLELNADEEVYVGDLKKKAHELVILVEGSGARVARGDILRLIELMDADKSGTISIVEFVHAVEKIAEGITPMSFMEVQHDVHTCKQSIERIEQSLDVARTEVAGIERFVQQQAVKQDTRISDQTADIHKSVQALSEQLCSSQSHLQQSVTCQVGEMAVSIQRLVDQKGANGDSLLHSSLRQQIEEVQRSVQSLLDRRATEVSGAMCVGQDGSSAGKISHLTSTVEHIEEAIQKLHDKIDSNATHATMSRQVAEMQKSVGRLVEKDSGDGRCQLAAASQMQAIGTSVQKLLFEKESQQDAQMSQQLEEMRTSVQKLCAEAQQRNELHVQQLQRQESSLLNGVAELGGVVLEGVGDLLTKRIAVMQTSLLNDLGSLQEITLKKLMPSQQPSAEAVSDPRHDT